MSYKELLDYKCSSLRSVTERTFGVRKNIWKILQNMPSYTFNNQVKIVIPTMVFRNYIWRYSQNHNHFNETIDKISHHVSKHISNIASHEESYDIVDNTIQDIIILRDDIAASLINAWKWK